MRLSHLILRLVVIAQLFAFSSPVVADELTVADETYVLGGRGTHLVKIPALWQRSAWHKLILPGVGVGKYVNLRVMQGSPLVIGAAGYLYHGRDYGMEHPTSRLGRLAAWPLELHKEGGTVTLAAGDNSVVGAYILDKINAKDQEDLVASKDDSDAEDYFYVLVRTQACFFAFCRQPATLEISY